MAAPAGSGDLGAARVLTRMGLADDGAPGDLTHHLKRAFGRAHIGALQTQIGVDHPDQRQAGEIVPLGHQLGADGFAVRQPGQHVGFAAAGDDGGGAAAGWGADSALP